MPKRTTNSRNDTPKDCSYSSRALNTREIKQRFLIVCEGTKTEPNYFRGFRVPTAIVKVQGVAEDPNRLVKSAQRLAAEDEYDQVWCVFDRDSWPAENFNNALRNAQKLQFHVAYSNESFELWYILHFQYLNTGLPRSDYEDKLSKLLGQEYKKNDPTMYQQLIEQGNQALAIKHAEKLLASYDPSNPEKDNPSTTVHLLVKALNTMQS
jgi:RloB-like protein